MDLSVTTQPLSANAPTRAYRSGPFPKTIVLYIAVALPVLAILAFAIFQPLLVLPRIGLGPGFTFTDQNGASLSHEDLRGKIVLYNFTYTNCNEPCRTSDTIMQQVQAALPTLRLRGIPVKLVTISIDPGRDTPAVLAAYAAQLGAKPDVWHFLTGKPLGLKYAVGGGFGVYYTEATDGTLTLEPAFALVDGVGILRARYRTATPELAILQRDLELVAKEAEESTGATRLAYEAAHLFLCYPK